MIQHDTTVLELGAAAGLPSLTAAFLGAAKVVATDYPDHEIIENLKENVEVNQRLISHRQVRDTKLQPNGRSDLFSEAKISLEAGGDGRDSTGQAEKLDQDTVTVLPHLWGSEVTPLLTAIAGLPSTNTMSLGATASENKFTLLILADLLYNHSSHTGLLHSLTSTLSRSNPSARALIFFTPYRPWLWDKDVAFLDMCKEAGLTVDKIWEKDAGRVMFESDEGSREMRSKVWGWEVRWKKDDDA